MRKIDSEVKFNHHQLIIFNEITFCWLLLIKSSDNQLKMLIITTRNWMTQSSKLTHDLCTMCSLIQLIWIINQRCLKPLCRSVVDWQLSFNRPVWCVSETFEKWLEYTETVGNRLMGIVTQIWLKLYLHVQRGNWVYSGDLKKKKEKVNVMSCFVFSVFLFGFNHCLAVLIFKIKHYCVLLIYATFINRMNIFNVQVKRS